VSSFIAKKHDMQSEETQPFLVKKYLTETGRHGRAKSSS
jgi:hypothetical protein